MKFFFELIAGETEDCDNFIAEEQAKKTKVV